jgi:CHAT domain/HYDIN/CFA65/VesB-like, Ig-like domain/Bacterial Ig domain
VEVVYQDFDLAIHGRNGGFHAGILGSPRGQAEGGFASPFSPSELEDLVLGVSRPREAYRDVRFTRGPVEAASLKDFGDRLFSAVFEGEVGRLLNESLNETFGGGGGLRIRLRLDGAPEAVNWPWEYLYDRARRQYPARSVFTPLVRYSPRDDLLAPQPLPIAPPVRILVMVSAPADRVRLKADAEWDRLKRTLDPLERAGRVAVDRLDHATLRDLQRKLGEAEYHAFHFIGHGGYDPVGRRGVLVFEDVAERAREVAAEDVAAILHDSPSLRLAVLNACEGARTSTEDPFAGTAQTLLHQGLPAVVGMQFPISDVAAVSFASGFYEAVAAGLPMDAAVTEGRKAVLADGNQVEWGTPVLYLRVPDGRAFDVLGPRPSLAVKTGDGVETPALRGAMPAPVAAADLLLQNGENGAGLAPNPSPPVPRRRAGPVLVTPRDFPELLDRENEISVAAQGVESGRAVEFHGEAGVGKSVLLRHLTHRMPGLPDGVVHLSAARRPAADILQFLFEAFFDSDPPVRATDAQLSRYLGAIQALVQLDDVELRPQELEALLDTMPASAFRLSADRRRLWGEGRSVELEGLPEKVWPALVERELGRALTDEERAQARALCRALGGHPLRILQAVAAGLDRPLEEVAAQAEAAVAAGAPPAEAVAPTSGSERRILGLLSVLDGVPLGQEHVAAVADVPDAGTELAALERRELVEAHSPRFALRQQTTKDLERRLDTTDWAAAILSYLATWAESNSHDYRAILDEAEAILTVLRRGARDGRWPAVLRLCRAVEDALVAGRRWGQWKEVLELELESAHALGDWAAEAWARHQLGSRAAALDDAVTARYQLSEALDVRESIGDRAGAELTRANLVIAAGAAAALPRLDDGRGPEPKPRPPRPWKQILLGAAMVGAVAVGAALFLGGDGEVVEGDPQIGVDPAEVDFGEVEVGTLGTESVEVVNVGDVPVAVGSVDVEGADAADFSGTGCEGATLGEGDGCTIAVTFRPLRAGPRGATMTIVFGEESSAEVPLQGVGRGVVVDDINEAPSIGTIEDQSVVEGAPPLELTVLASDADLDPLRLSVTERPSFVTFKDVGDGSGILTISPGPGEAGEYMVTVSVTDGTAKDSEDFVITVDPPSDLRFEEKGLSRDGFTVENVGRGAAEPFVVEVTMESVDPETEETVVETVGFDVGRLEPSQEESVEFACFSGTLTGVIDPTDAIVESNEENNNAGPVTDSCVD